MAKYICKKPVFFMGMPYNPGDALQTNSIAPPAYFEVYSENKHGKRWRDDDDYNQSEPNRWDPFERVKNI